MIGTIGELRAGFAAGEIAPESVAAGVLAVIDERDGGEDGLNALISVNRAVVTETGYAGAPGDRRGSDSTGPLSGVPLVVKDNIDTVDLGCTAGSVLLSGVPVLQDAPLVAAIKNAGAVIAGKANLSEWANFRSRRSVSGWSSAGGQTRNPLSPTRTPCGSSSGSAAAVAAGYVPAAIGTETDGSIICPAATMGLVGFKPTVGRVPQAGIVPISWSQDSAGPITRTVEDSWILERVLERAGGSAGAAGGVGGAPDSVAGAAGNASFAQLHPAGLAGARVGVFDPGENVHPAVRGLFRGAVDRLAAAGAIPVPIPPFDRAGEVEAAEWIILQYEFFLGIERYLSERRPAAPYRTLRDLHRANLERADATLSLFGQDIWDAILDGVSQGTLAETTYRGALDTVERLARKEGIDRWFADRSLDVIVAPANGPAWVIDTVNGDRYTGTATPPSAAAGYPVLTVPMGTVRGLPIGLGFYAPGGLDEHLFSFGLAWERLADATAMV